MKIAVISDVHSNLEALTSALDAIDDDGVDAIYCLGDVVGYGADAAACVDMVRERCTAVVRGNHDEAVALDQGVNFLPKDAQRAVVHNRKSLSPEQVEYLASLPLVVEAHGICFVHSSPQTPHYWLRIESLNAAMAQFDFFSGSMCFIGHTHIPAVMANKLGILRVRPGYRFLINVGSIGQPRDQNPRLSFSTFDTDAFEHVSHRLPYDVEKAATKILAAGLPPRLAERLKVGR